LCYRNKLTEFATQFGYVPAARLACAREALAHRAWCASVSPSSLLSDRYNLSGDNVSVISLLDCEAPIKRLISKTCFGKLVLDLA
jgi:hypothetical protein